MTTTGTRGREKVMKRRTSLAVVIAGIGLVLTACGGEATSGAGRTPVATPEVSQSDASSPSETAEPVESETTVEANEMDDASDLTVDEGLLTTEVKIPADFIQGQTKEEIESDLEKEGWNISVKLNKNGSATYTMSRFEFNRFKDELRTSMEAGIQELIDDEPKLYKSVTFNDDFNTFDVTVNRKKFESGISMFSFGVTFASKFFQIFSGVGVKDRFTIVNYIDESTGEVFDTYDSRDN